jgi:hypothetical protein
MYLVNPPVALANFLKARAGKAPRAELERLKAAAESERRSAVHREALRRATRRRDAPLR